MDEEFGIFIIGVLIGATVFLISLALQDNLVTVETDKLTNTKYVEYQDTIYTLTFYKKITKEK